MANYESRLEGREAVLRTNPGSAQAERDVSMSNEPVAALVGAHCDGLDQTELCSDQALDLHQQILQSEPCSYFNLRSLATSA